MKLVAIAIFSLLVVSCGTAQKGSEKQSSKVCLDMSSSTTSASYPDDTTFADLNVCFYEDLKEPHHFAVNELIKTYMGVQWMSENSIVNDTLNSAYFEKFIAAFFEEYTLAKTDWEDMGPWFLEMDISIDDSSLKNFVNCALTTYTYTGGAHPNGAITYYVVNKSTGELLFLEDVCINITELNKKVEPYFLAQNEIPVGTNYEEYGLSFDDNQFHVSENYWFDTENIYFFYNQYEIGPYSAGTFEVKVPIVEIQELFSIEFN